MIKFLEVKYEEFDVCTQYRFCFEAKNDKTNKIQIYEFPLVIFNDDNKKYDKRITLVILEKILGMYEFTNIEMAFQLFNSWIRSMKYDL